MKDGRTHPACTPEHALAPDTCTVVAAEVREAGEGEASKPPRTREASRKGLIRITPTPPALDNPVDLITDKGYFSQDALKELDDGLLARIKTGRSAPRGG